MRYYLDCEFDGHNAEAHTARRRRVCRVEYDPGWGWIARKADGSEVVPGFVWNSRSVARDVARQSDMFPTAFEQVRS